MKVSTYDYYHSRHRKNELREGDGKVGFSEFMVEHDEPMSSPREFLGSDRIVIRVSLSSGGQIEVNVSSEVVDIESLFVRAGVFG